MPDTPSFEIEQSLSGPVAGIDEAGRGPWAGPVVAAAVILDPRSAPTGLNDSKALTEKRREALAAEIWASAQVGVGLASVQEIDRVNIGRATLLAMARAVANLPVRPSSTIIDGKLTPKLPCRAVAVVKGDAKSCSVAAASIIAKVTRDRMMIALADEFPGYAWERNKGYGAKAHREGLDLLGVTPHHRRSFAPIAAMLDDKALRDAA